MASERHGAYPKKIRLVVKPHPNCPIDRFDYPSIEMEMQNAPIDELARECDAAYTSNLTSAAIDSYCLGLPTISMLDGDSFNMSPLRGADDVIFVTSPLDLAYTLQRMGELKSSHKNKSYLR